MEEYLDCVQPGHGAKFGATFEAHGFTLVEAFDVAEEAERTAVFAALRSSFAGDADATALEIKLTQRMPDVPTDGVRLCVLEDILAEILSPEFRAKATARLASAEVLSDVARTSLQQIVDGEPTTADACFQLVVPATNAAKCSYAEARKILAAADVQHATIFLSHAWKYDFADVVSAMRTVRQADLDSGKPEPYFWFDIACVNQHRTSEVSPKWWCVLFCLSRLCVRFAPD